MIEAAEMESMVEALIEANDLLLGMYDLTAATAGSLDEAEVVHDLLEQAIRIVHADGLALDASTARFGIGDHRWLSADAEPPTGINVTTVTESHGSGLVGQLHAARRSHPFSTGDRKMLSAVLRTTLNAIETSRLHAQAVDDALVTQDVRRAAEVAQLALPRTHPRPSANDVFLQTVQARETGGDLCCFRDEDDQLSFAIGDVSGKGLPAAVMMTTAVCATRAAFRDRRLHSPIEQLQSVNDWMFEHLSDAGLFMSLFIGHYRPSDGTLTWANAGHSPCMVASNRGVDDLPASCPPLGVLPLVDGVVATTPLALGDRLLIGSDGLIEQPSESGLAFGEHGLRRLLATAPGASAAELGRYILGEVTAHGGTLPQSDDRTLLVLCHEANGVGVQ